MKFKIDHTLLKEAQSFFATKKKIHWILGGSGAGKTTVCKTLAEQFQIPVYDMDAQIYGAYHERFTDERHPVNKAWSNAENGMTWLLNLSWDEFDNFHHAALPEYLDLLVEDLAATTAEERLIIDGGIWHPALLAQALPPEQIICLASEESSVEIWEGNPERLAMKEMFTYYPDPEASWRKFLDFDARITATIKNEAKKNNILLIKRRRNENVESFGAKVAQALGLK